MAVTTLGSFPGANDKDKSARIPAAIAALNRALAGDMASLKYMHDQAIGSATAVGKDAFRRAIDYYESHQPTPEQPAAVDPRLQAPKPLPLPGVSIPNSTPAPVGFAPVPPDISHPPVIRAPGIEIHGAVPGVITEVAIGRPNVDPIPVVRRVFTAPRTITVPESGGVYTGPPMDGDRASSAPASTSTAIAQTSGATTAAAAGDTAPTSTPPADNKFAWLILAAGVVLFALVDAGLVNHKRK